jgi:MPBQ/MSBQ methyltransferase
VQRGHEVTAIDFSFWAATLCRQACGQTDRARIIIADGLRTPFRDSSFDTVIAYHITGHLPADSRRKLAAEIYRVLTPSGTLHFRDFSTADFRYGSGTETERGTFRRGSGIISHYFSEPEVTSLFVSLSPRTIGHHEWQMRVMGENLIRSEITAILEKQR